MIQSASLVHCVVRCAELSTEAGSAKEAGRYAALIAAIATCRALLTAQCMPCGRYTQRPGNQESTMRWPPRSVPESMRMHVQRWCAPVLKCERLPTNGYIITTLPIGGGVGMPAPARCLPWFANTSIAKIAVLMKTWWNGPSPGPEWARRVIDVPWLWRQVERSHSQIDIAG